MTFRERNKLAYREIAAYKTRSLATIIVMGVIYGLMIAACLITYGYKNISLNYAGNTTNNVVYLTSYFEKRDIVIKRIQEYGGQVIQTEDIAQFLTDETSFLDAGILARFDNVDDAYKYTILESQYNNSEYQIRELFGNQVSVYGEFREFVKNFLQPAEIALAIVASLILATTIAYIISSNPQGFALYRSIGASKTQIMLIYLRYVIILCTGAAIFAIAFGVILAMLATAIGWHHISAQFAGLYPNSKIFSPILIGMSAHVPAVLLSIFATIPVSFLLSLDHFSDKRNVQKLKERQ